TDATSVLSPEARQIWPLFSRCSYKAQVEADELGQRETALVEALKTEQERSAEALNQLREYQRRLADREGAIASREALIGTLRSDLEEKIAGYGQLEKALGLLQSRLSSLSEELRLANYGNLVGRVRKDVTRILPPGAKVIVISKGDSELLELEARTGWHFPRGEDGGYSGYYPADSAEAIRQLESLCGDGGEFLVIPSTAFWWLEHYDRFTYYLDTHFQRI